MVDTKSAGYEVDRKLDKLGLRVSDTAELNFTDIKVPVEDVLGELHMGFSYLGPTLAKICRASGWPSPWVRTPRPRRRSASRRNTPRTAPCSASRWRRSRTPNSNWRP